MVNNVKSTRGHRTLLMLTIMPGDGAVSGLGFHGLSVGAHEDGGHHAQGAVTLRNERSVNQENDMFVKVKTNGNHVEDQE